MSKYLTVLKLTLSQYVAFRLQVIMNIFSGFITPGFMLLALSFARNNSGSSVSNLLPYYLVVAFVFPITICTVDDEMDALTEKGEIYQFLVKPFYMYRWLLIKHFSEKVIPLLFLLPFVLIGFMTLRPNVSVEWISLPGALIALLLGFVLSFNISYLVGLFCFWLDEFWAIHNLKYVLLVFLSGSVLPYTFFPSWLSSFLLYTPFPYLVTWVYRVLNGQIFLRDYLLVLVWIAVIGYLVRVLEQRAINHFSYVGG